MVALSLACKPHLRMLLLTSKNSWSIKATVRGGCTASQPLGALDLRCLRLGLLVACSKYRHFLGSRNLLYNTYTQIQIMKDKISCPKRVRSLFRSQQDHNILPPAPIPISFHSYSLLTIICSDFHLAAGAGFSFEQRCLHLQVCAECVMGHGINPP